MPEEGIETQELKENLEEAAEHAHGEGGEQSEKRSWTLWLSLSTAIIAVLAAVASLESGAYANDAIVQKDDAILHQSKADDDWGYYQAKGIKAAIYATQADPKWQAEGEREKKEQKELQATAEEDQKQVKEMDEKSEHSLHLHHQFAKSVTIFQVAIALAAIAALTRRKPMWWVSLGVGAAGALFFVMGFLPG
ncbi:MAG TPA: DUF4337 family protein [Polyangiaceae bacterium]|jgi:hypothetical protein